MAYFVRCDRCGAEASYQQGRIIIDDANGSRLLVRDICNKCAMEFVALFEKGKK